MECRYYAPWSGSIHPAAKLVLRNEWKEAHYFIADTFFRGDAPRKIQGSDGEVKAPFSRRPKCTRGRPSSGSSCRRKPGRSTFCAPSRATRNTECAGRSRSADSKPPCAEPSARPRCTGRRTWRREIREAGGSTTYGTSSTRVTSPQRSNRRIRERSGRPGGFPLQVQPARGLYRPFAISPRSTEQVETARATSLPSSVVTSHSTSPTERPRWTTFAFAYSFSSKTGRR